MNTDKFKNYTVLTSSGCWEWTKTKDRDGYGICYFREFNTRRAHRISYLINKGKIPKGLYVLHRCDNPPCINPDHLFLGTHKDNMEDCSKKGRVFARYRGLTECINGHSFDKTNTGIRKNGNRYCKKCTRIRATKTKNKTKGETNANK